MDDIKIRVIDSKKLIEAINTGSYEINLSAVMALGAAVAQPASSDWIQCTPETMPKETGSYLVTIRWDGGGYYTDLFTYDTRWGEWREEERIFGTVVAWQPKPQPWKGEQDGI